MRAQAPCPLSCPTADDIELQATLDTTAAAGGGVVHLEPRTYFTCTALIVGTNTHLRGAGRGVTIIRGSTNISGKVVDNSYVGASIGTVGTRNVTISDLTVDHATCARNANGIAFLPGTQPGGDYDGQESENGVVERVEVLGSPSYHSYMIWNLKGRHMKIVDNWVDGGATDQQSPQEGIESFGGLDVLIANNTVRNIGYACLNVGSAGLPDSGTVGVTMTGNYLENCQIGVNLGTSLMGSEPMNQTHTKVIGNTIVAARFVGIDVAVVDGTMESDLIISNNTIRDISANAAIGIRMRASGGPIGPEAVVANTIAGNHIENIRGKNAHGIRLTGYHDVRVIDNTITGVDYGGVFALDSNDLEIVGNRIERVGTATANLAPIVLQSSVPSGFQRFVVENNLLRNWLGLATGILVLNGKQGTIRGNVFTRNDTAQPSPVIVTSGSCDVTVSGNVAWYLPAWAGGALVPACP